MITSLFTIYVQNVGIYFFLLSTDKIYFFDQLIRLWPVSQYQLTHGMILDKYVEWAQSTHQTTNWSGSSLHKSFDPFLGASFSIEKLTVWGICKHCNKQEEQAISSALQDLKK